MRPFNKIIFSNGTWSRFIIQFSHYRFIIIFICISTWRNRMLSKLSLPLGRESSTSRTIKYLLRTKPHSIFSLIFQSERRIYKLLPGSFLCPWLLPIAIVFDRTVLLLVLCLILQLEWRWWELFLSPFFCFHFCLSWWIYLVRTVSSLILRLILQFERRWHEFLFGIPILLGFRFVLRINFVRTILSNILSFIFKFERRWIKLLFIPSSLCFRMILRIYLMRTIFSFILRFILQLKRWNKSLFFSYRCFFCFWLVVGIYFVWTVSSLVLWFIL